MSDTSKRESLKEAIQIQNQKGRKKQIETALAAADKINNALRDKKRVERVVQKIQKGNIKTISDITENGFFAVLREVTVILHDENSLLELDCDHVIVVGDIYGQFRDIIRIFDKFGYPPDQTYLFLGMS